MYQRFRGEGERDSIAMRRFDVARIPKSPKLSKVSEIIDCRWLGPPGKIPQSPAHPEANP